MPVKLEYDKARRTIRKRVFGSWIKHPKLVVNCHWPMMRLIFRRMPTLTACMIGPIEIVWPRRGYVLPESAAGH